jgi:DNA gyrase inhibitor GyrI
MQPEIRIQPKQRIAYVERLGLPDGTLGNCPMDAWSAIIEYVKVNSLEDRMHPSMAVMPDGVMVDTTRAPRYWACYNMMDDGPLPEGAGVRQEVFDPGKVAVFVYRGPYSGLGEAWGNAMGKWFPASGLTMRKGPWFEVYVDNPQEVAEDELRTEICVPVE